MNKMFTALLMAFALVAGLATAATVPLSIDYVEINGDKYTSTNTIAEKLELGEPLELTVKVTASQDVEDVQIEAYISGYRYSSYERDLVSDITKAFDLEANTSDKFDLNLEVPVKMDKDDIKLRIRVSDKNSDSYEQVYQLRVRGVDESNAIQIKSMTVSPSDEVQAGYPLSFKVKVQNYGDDDLDDVSVKVAIPQLGISDDETIDEIEADETETFEELLLRVPKCAKAGTYTAIATVEFDEYEETTKEMTITVTSGDACEAASTPATSTQPSGKTVVTVPESQEVVIGSTGAVYPVMISNLGSTAKTYTLSVSGADSWGVARFDPGAVVIVQPESVKTVYLHLSAAEDAPAGLQVFKLTLQGTDEEKQVVLTANLKDDGKKVAGYDSLRRGLEIGLIVLVVVLIILGLIIGFNKLKGSEKGADDDSSQTYY